MTATETVDLIRHPRWCRHVPADAPRAGTDADRPSYYERIAPAEDSDWHESRDYRLETDGLTYSAEVTIVRSFEWDGDVVLPHETAVRLTLKNHELVDADDTIYLNKGEVDRLITMLKAAKHSLRDE